jgi:stage V sporulation protein G
MRNFPCLKDEELRKIAEMEITEVRVFLANEDKVKAYVSIILDDCFVIRDLKIIAGESELFVAMPTRKNKDGTFKDIAHPINAETRELLEKKVFDAYEAARKRK